jgi:hypothetical protein
VRSIGITDRSALTVRLMPCTVEPILLVAVETASSIEPWLTRAEQVADRIIKA